MYVRNTVKSIQDIMRQDVGVDGDAQRISQLCWMFFLKIIDDQDRELELMQDDYSSPIPEKFRWRNWAANPEGMTGDALLAFVNGEMFPALKDLPVTAKEGRRRVVREVFQDAYNYMKSGQLMRQVINKINAVDFNNLAERQHFGDIYEQILNDLQSAGNAGEYYTPRAVTAFMADRIDPHPGEILFDPACGTGGFLTCSIRHMRERYVKTPADEQKMQQALRATEKKQLPHMLCVTNMLLHNIDDPSFVRHDNTLARPYISYTQSDRVDIVLTNPPFGGREEDGIETNFPKHFQTRETADLFSLSLSACSKPAEGPRWFSPTARFSEKASKPGLRSTYCPNVIFTPLFVCPTAFLNPTLPSARTCSSSLKASRPRKSGITSTGLSPGKKVTR
jgi:type I restriction enzyme M protein